MSDVERRRGSDVERRRGSDVRLAKLEHRYRRLLFAYPPGYRAGYGDELIGTILDTTEPGRSLPSPREAAALVVGGLRARAVHAATGAAWADGVHLGATVLAVLNLATLVRYAGSVPLWTALSALTLLAVLRGWTLLALPLVAVTAVKTAGLAMGRVVLDTTVLPVFPDPLLPGTDVWDASALHSLGGPVAPVAGYVLLFLALLALALRGGPARARSWWWLLTVPMMAVTDPAWLHTADSPRTMARVGLEITLLGLAIWAGHVTRDTRWAVAGGMYLLVALVLVLENVTQYQRQDLSHWGLLAVLTVMAAAVPFRARRHALL